jgi:DNA-binding transcriptional MerR regulator
MLMTLADFTRRLAVLSKERPATLNRQVRLWTEAGLLPLASGVFLGTGKARLYTDESLLVAAIAVEASAWGLPIRDLKKVLESLVAELRDPQSGLREVADGVDDRTLRDMLLLFRQPNPEGLGEVVKGHLVRVANLADLVQVDGFTSPGFSVYVIELRRLWGKVR